MCNSHLLGSLFSAGQKPSKGGLKLPFRHGNRPSTHGQHMNRHFQHMTQKHNRNRLCVCFKHACTGVDCSDNSRNLLEHNWLRGMRGANVNLHTHTHTNECMQCEAHACMQTCIHASTLAKHCLSLTQRCSIELLLELAPCVVLLRCSIRCCNHEQAASQSTAQFACASQ